MEIRLGIEPSYVGLQATAFTVQPTYLMALLVGLAPTAFSLTGSCSTIELQEIIGASNGNWTRATSVTGRRAATTL